MERLDTSRAPVLVTLARIGNHCIVDTTPEEETVMNFYWNVQKYLLRFQANPYVLTECVLQVSSASLLVAVCPDGRLATVRKLGKGSFHPGTLAAATSLAISVGDELNTALTAKLKQEEELGDTRQKVGFL